MQKYHAHVYYQPHQLPEMKHFQELASSSPLKIWKLFDRSVGPHALPMLELHFTNENKEEAIRWLKDHHGVFSVLIHEDTGDDYQDHERARWLGDALPIDFKFFDQVKQNPNLAIHPVP